MSSFTTPLIVSPMPDGRRWKLYRSFKYHIGSRYSKNVISVPRHFITDFASVPRITSPLVTLGALLLLLTGHTLPTIIILTILAVLSWFSPYGKHQKPAVLHDYGYKTKKMTRKQVDDVFLESMKVVGVSVWRRSMEYYAVRLFGWLAWHRERAVRF